MHDLVTRATAHANEFEDVRPASCALLRECAAEIERLRRENQDWVERSRAACARIARLRDDLRLQSPSLCAVDARVAELQAKLERLAAGG